MNDRQTDQSLGGGNLGDQALRLHHQQLLSDSGIAPDIAPIHGDRSVTEKAELLRLSFSSRQCQIPTLLILVWNVNGEIELYQNRPDSPRIERGKAVKYETPRGSHMIVDVPPACVPLAQRSAPSACPQATAAQGDIADNGEDKPAGNDEHKMSAKTPSSERLQTKMDNADKKKPQSQRLPEVSRLWPRVKPNQTTNALM